MEAFEQVRHLEPYMACDIIEMYIACGLYTEVSTADVRDMIRDLGVEDGLLYRRAAKITGTENNEEDTVDLLLNDYFTHFELRNRMMGKAYPFITEGTVLKVKPNFGSLDLYSLFLFSSRLDMVHDKAIAHQMALAFEDICAQVTKKQLGGAFAVHALGTHPSASTKLFSTDKRILIKRLARWLNERIDDYYYQDVTSASGDHGIDLVGKLRAEPYAKGSSALVGQCAASSDETYWKKKKQDLDRITNEVITFMTPPQKVIYIPCFYRDNKGDWKDRTQISKMYLCDRPRIAPGAVEAMIAPYQMLIANMRNTQLPSVLN